MERLDSNLSSDNAQVDVSVSRVDTAERAALVKALAPAFMAGNINSLMDGNVNFSIEALRRLTLATGRTLTDHQLKAVKQDLLLFLDKKGVRTITLWDVKNWTDSVKSRIAAQISPLFESGAVSPSYRAVASQLDKFGYALVPAKINEVKNAIETRLQDIGVTSVTNAPREAKVTPDRLSFAAMYKLLNEIRPHFVGGRGYISVQDVEEKLKEFGHNLGKAKAKQLRAMLLASLQQQSHKEYTNDGQRAEFDLIATKLAQHFVLNEKYLPRRTDIVRLCKDLMGIEMPYYRTDVILAMMFEVAPSLNQRRKRNAPRVQPELLKSAEVKQSSRFRLSHEVREFHSALAGAIGAPLHPTSSILEHAALILAYGIYSGKIELAGLLPGMRKMTAMEMETTVRMLKRLNFAET